jgi:hypothetical protein
MQKKTLVWVISMFLAFSMGGCAGSSQKKKVELGTLQTAVEQSARVVIGEYGAAIPADFNASEFMKVINGKIPADYYENLKKHPIDLKPFGSYYLLTVYDKCHKKTVLLFDYSCTPQTDGLVYENPKKFDLNHLENYNPCK